MVSKIRNIVKKTGKPIGRFVLATVVIVTTMYYAYCYIYNGNNLSFSYNEEGSLFLFMIAIILSSIALIFANIRICKLESSMAEIIQEIAEFEDNSVNFSRITQELILDLSDKFNGVGSDGKKS